MFDLRPASSRMHTRIDWLDSWHCFSFGSHYDPTNTHHGLLLVSNDDRVAAGGGFGSHSHRDMEIVTWVLDGELLHRDSEGNEGIIRPGLAQRMSAGTGISHSEMNASSSVPVHFVQMWVPPDSVGIAPGYEQQPVGEKLDTGTLVGVAGPDSDAAVHIHQSEARLFAVRLPEGAMVELPEAPHVHVFVALGEALFDADGTTDTTAGGASGGMAMVAGDAARLTDPTPATLRATVDGTEVLVWATA